MTAWSYLRIPSASVLAIRQNILDAYGGSPEAAMELVGRIGWLMENSLEPASPLQQQYPQASAESSRLSRAYAKKNGWLSTAGGPTTTKQDEMGTTGARP